MPQSQKIIGIDLGTTNSAVAVMEGGTPKVILTSEGRNVIPSVIEPVKNLVGDLAKRQMVLNPTNTLYSIKRLIGRRIDDAEVKRTQGMVPYKIVAGRDNMASVEISGKVYTPQEISAKVLQKAKADAEKYLGEKISDAVITVPAYFDDSQRQATKQAGEIAGLNVVRIVNEPTAAALAYGMDKKKKGIIAVYDLGGGTFDISILHINDGIFEVLSTHGDTYLGGDDLDQAVVRTWMKQLKVSENDLETDKALAQQLRLTAENAKIELSTNESYTTSILDQEIVLRRSDFEDLIRPLVLKTISACSEALKDAGLHRSQIEEVIMVGGSTRVPLVKKMVAEFFGRTVHDDLDPDEVVAIGAAVQADILAGNNKDVLLLDITPLSLGIETMGGLMDVLIPRNSKIPARIARQYTTQRDGQTGMRITVYQGERDMVQDNRKLAEFDLAGIPSMPAGLPKVEISFLINADGILVVKAKELRSGIEQSIEIKPQAGLSDQDVETILTESIDHAREDIQKRALAEAKAEASLLIDTTRNYLSKNGEMMTDTELKTTMDAITQLEYLLSSQDKDAILRSVESLNDISKPYAERIMNEAIGIAMRGKKI